MMGTLLGKAHRHRQTFTGCCPNPISLSEKNFWPF